MFVKTINRGIGIGLKISTSGFPEITGFEAFVEDCDKHYYNYQETCKHRQVEAITEEDFEDSFATIKEEYGRMLLALRLRRFVEINEGQVIRFMPNFINPGKT